LVAAEPLVEWKAGGFASATTQDVFGDKKRRYGTAKERFSAAGKFQCSLVVTTAGEQRKPPAKSGKPNRATLQYLLCLPLHRGNRSKCVSL